MNEFVNCINCANMDLRPVTRQQAANGTAMCKLSGLYVMQQLNRNCAAYEPAPADVVQKRHEWIKKIKEHVDL